jgi:large subunit ribosomal protein L17
MRHLKRTAKLGRTGTHRNRMLASLVCSLIKHRRVTTTLAKAKAARSVAEKMITLGKAGTLHDRRLASARLHQDEEAVKALFNEIAPTQKERRGGYTRIVRLGQRQGDAAQLVILEFVNVPLPEAAPEAATAEAETPAEKTEEKKETPAPA